MAYKIGPLDAPIGGTQYGCYEKQEDAEIRAKTLSAIIKANVVWSIWDDQTQAIVSLAYAGSIFGYKKHLRADVLRL